MKRLLLLAVLSGPTILLSPPLFAHHGVANYDMTKTITLTGRVTGFDWTNPHCLIHMDATDANGTVEHWTLELTSTPTMSRHGWNRNSLKVGDEVEVETHPAKNGAPIGQSGTTESIKHVVVNGKPLPT